MNNRIIELKYGIFLALAGFLWVCLEFAVGLHTKYIDLHPKVTVLGIIPVIALSILGLSEKIRSMGSEASAVKIMLSGLLIALISGLLSAGLQWVFFTFINPHFFADFTRFAVEHGYSTEEEARGYFNLASYMQQGLIGTIGLGIFITLIRLLVWVIRKR